MKHLLTILMMLCISLCTNAQVAGGQISRQKSQKSTQKSTPKTTPKPAPQTTKRQNHQTTKRQNHQTTKRPDNQTTKTTHQGSGGGSSSRQIPAVIQNLIANMVRVEGGTFTMGATPEQGSDAGSDESPTHQVTLSSFSIGKYEVTQEEWEAVMGSNPSSFKGAKLPVEKVSWNDCQEFIRRLNQMTGKSFRLPTEAEWEFAARGGNRSNHYKYSGSNNLSSVVWYTDNSGSKTHPVGQKSPNELGLYDMSGNVWEWCADWYGDYISSAQTNPKGPSNGYCRVFRGGSWRSSAWNCRMSYRISLTPSGSFSYLGLRLAF